MVDEFKQRLQPLEEAAHRKLEKSKRKMRRGMNVEKQEEEEVQTPVKDVELQTVVDVTASEQSVLEEKKKNEDEIFPFQVQFYTALAKEISIHSKTLNIRRLNYHKPISLTNITNSNKN
ncbi:unnamed protein product [Trifolium pratense]|uniref:Uncharacterized protein n=1 Tax=Trifolium pratense TaxID=57577 RepID=A0ACB0J3M0_TRIPR|nr:unnamed protein product [Trifolium pratense]